MNLLMQLELNDWTLEEYVLARLVAPAIKLGPGQTETLNLKLFLRALVIKAVASSFPTLGRPEDKCSI